MITGDDVYNAGPLERYTLILMENNLIHQYEQFSLIHFSAGYNFADKMMSQHLMLNQDDLKMI